MQVWGSDRVACSAHLRLALLGVGVGVALGGCETTPVVQTGRLDVRAAIARGDLPSPKAVAVSMVSIDGAPGPIADRLKQILSSEAATRDITLTDPSLARYVLRGYLDAYATETGTSVHYVWDVYDSLKQRTKRLEDAVDLPASSTGEAWSGVNDDVVAGIASRSADDLAVFLGQTPEVAVQAAIAAPGHVPNGMGPLTP